MAFTDDDLRRLKIQYCTGHPSEQDETMCSLLARLEAAENYINALTTGSGIKTAHLFESEWRKAAGNERPPKHGKVFKQPRNQ